MQVTFSTLVQLDLSQNDVSHDVAEQLVACVAKRCQVLPSGFRV